LATPGDGDSDPRARTTIDKPGPARHHGRRSCLSSLYAVKSDPEFCARFLADPRAAGTELGLSPAEHAALSPFDRDALVGLGGHPYLVFMADLRLRMARDPGALEYF
jgi:hypothetical protein